MRLKSQCPQLLTGIIVISTYMTALQFNKTMHKKCLTGCWQTANGQRILKIRVIFSPDKFQALAPDKFQAS